MERARNICTKLRGRQAEAILYEQFQHDLDEYIHAACSDTQRGIQCTACQRNTCSVQLLQTRSADEGMTAYLSCSSCSHRTILG